MTNYDFVVCQFNCDMSICVPDEKYREQLIYRNGDKCLANIHDAIFLENGYWMVDIIFEDDREFIAYMDELTVL